MEKQIKQRFRATWVSRKERNIWCCDFSGFGSDRQALLAEIQASEAVIRQQPENSLLVAVYVHGAVLEPDVVRFFERSACPTKNPIRKLALLGVSDVQRIWYQMTKHVVWPKHAGFFDDYEKAKDWLVGEQF